MSELNVIFSRYVGGDLRQYLCKGRIAQILLSLVNTGESGIAALEVSRWAIRLTTCIHCLRQDYGLDIQTVRESHKTGVLVRHILVTPVGIIQAIESK